MAAHGFMRLTQDIDVSLGVDVDRFGDVLAAVGQGGFTPVTSDPLAFARETNVLLLVDPDTGIRIDLVFTFIPFERAAIRDAETVVFKGFSLKVASLGHLVVYKLLAGRARDIEDITMILNDARRELDEAALTSTIQGLSTALGVDMDKVWNSLLGETGDSPLFPEGKAGNPDRPAP